MQSLRDRRRALVKKYGRRALQAIDHYLGRESLVGDHPFFDPDLFPYNRELEHNWRAIRAELDRLLETREQIPPFHEISPDQSRISTGDHWRAFILYGFGHKAERNCRQCPITTGVLETIPHLQSAWFSMLNSSGSSIRRSSRVERVEKSSSGFCSRGEAVKEPEMLRR